MQDASETPPSHRPHSELIMGFVPKLLIYTNLAESGLKSAFIGNHTPAGGQVRGSDVHSKRSPIYL